MPIYYKVTFNMSEFSSLKNLPILNCTNNLRDFPHHLKILQHLDCSNMCMFGFPHLKTLQRLDCSFMLKYSEFPNKTKELIYENTSQVVKPKSKSKKVYTI
jgi:hypothetical protein